MAGRSKRIFIALRDRVTSLPDYNFLTKKRDEEKKDFKQASKQPPALALAASKNQLNARSLPERMMAMCTTAASVSSASSSLPSPTSSSQVTSAAEAVSRIVASEPEDATIEELGRATASACNLIDDDFAGSSDEVKIFKDEGEDEEKEYVSQEELQAALSEDKSSLIQETELSIKQEALRLTDSSIGRTFFFLSLLKVRKSPSFFRVFFPLGKQKKQ